jgi:hypothetical protein
MNRNKKIYQSTDKENQVKNKFVLDCTDKSLSKYQIYNPLKDKFLRYIVPCPCNSYIKSKCLKKPLTFIRTEGNEIVFDNTTRNSQTQASSYWSSQNIKNTNRMIK